MVYCQLIQNKTNSAIYRFGSTIADMTGTIEFFKDKEPSVIKPPDKRTVTQLWIRKLCVKYRDDFSHGRFKEKIAYEC